MVFWLTGNGLQSYAMPSAPAGGAYLILYEETG